MALLWTRKTPVARRNSPNRPEGSRATGVLPKPAGAEGSDEVVAQLVDDGLAGVDVLGGLGVDLGVGAATVVKTHDATVGR